MNRSSDYLSSEQISGIIRDLKSTYGHKFFNQITSHFQRIIEADYTYIGETDSAVTEITVIAGRNGNSELESFSYPLEGAPCYKVITLDECVYTSNVQNEYPNDQLLKDLDIEGYIGVPLPDSTGSVIGILVALFKREIPEPEKVANLLELFAGRIAVELERQKKEKELESKKNQIENLTNKMPGLVLQYYLKPDGTDGVYYLSEGVKKVYGIERDDALRDIGLVWKQVLPEEIPALVESIQKSAKTLEDWDHVFKAKSLDGTLKYLRGIGTPHKEEDGTIVWDTITLDVTEQFERELELKQKQQQLNDMSNRVPGLVYQYRLHPDGTDSYPFLSKGIEEILETEHESAQKNSQLHWDGIHDEDIDKIKESIRVSAENLTEWNQIFRIITPSGKTKYLQGLGTPKKLEDGTIEWSSMAMDITEQVERQNEIKEKQELLESITDHIPGVVLKYKLDEQGQEEILYISDGVEDIYGIPRETAKNHFELVWARKFPEDIPGIKASIMESARTMAPWDHLYRYYGKEGDIRYLQGYGTPVKHEDNSIVWNAITIDVTEQINQKSLIEAKQKQLKSITDKLPGIVLKYALHPDNSDEVLYISNGVRDIFGLEVDDVLNEPSLIWDKYVEEYSVEMRRSIAKSAEHLTPWEFLTQFYRPDGSIGYIQAYGVPQKMEDDSIHWDTILLDVTDQKIAEEKVSATNQKLRSYIDSSPLAIYQIDDQGVVTDFWNPGAEDIFGWERDQVIGKRPPHFKTEHTKEFMEIMEDIRITKRPKQFIVKRENKYREFLTLEITASPLFNDDGKLTDLLIIANDITELEEYRSTLEKALREKEVLLQEVHHRVKNNLAIISGLLELQIMKEGQTKDVSLLIEARNRIHSIAMVHEQLYQDMDFSHIHPANYYEKLLTKLGSNALSGGEEIEYDLRFDIDRISINRAVPLGLLINELFTNSIKHAFNSKQQNKVTLHFYEENGRIKVIYADNGPGFEVDKIRNKNTIGWQLIETLLLQLDSEYELNTDGEFSLEFTFLETTTKSQAVMT